MSEPATLPESLREPEPRLLSDLQIGEKRYISLAHMQPNAQGFCFLRPTQS